MAYLFSTKGDLLTCREQLEESANRSHKFDVKFVRQPNNDDSLNFKVRRKDTKIKGVSPIFYGSLSPSGQMTQVSGRMGGGRSGTNSIKSWCYGMSVLGSMALAAVIVLAIRTRAAGYVDEPSGTGLLLILFVFVGIFFASVAADSQRKEPREMLTWLYSCFDAKLNEETIEKVGTLKNQIDLGDLGRRALKFSAAGLVAGIAFGFMADIEDNLDPLTVPITNFHTCTKSDDGSGFTQKEIFKRTEVIYGCGDMKIEIVDRREIKIPFSLRWEYQVDKSLYGFITHEANTDGKFMMPLKTPIGGSYQVGKYSLTLSRGGGRAIQDSTAFEIVD